VCRLPQTVGVCRLPQTVCVCRLPQTVCVCRLPRTQYQRWLQWNMSNVQINKQL